jgi:hypothetical protein
MKAKLLLIALLLPSACNMGDRERGERRERPPFEQAARNEETRRDAIENGAESVTGNSAALTAPADKGAQLASAPAPGGLSRDWFAGSWTDSGNCSDAATFSPDGQYRLADGTRGMWSVRNGRLVVQNDKGRNQVQLRRVGDDAVEIVGTDGTVGRSTRC